MTNKINKWTVVDDLVVKLVDTKDLKAEGFTKQLVSHSLS